MKNRPSATILILLGFLPPLIGSDPPQVMRDEPVVLKPYIVIERILADAGFMINAKAKKGSKAAGDAIGAFLVVIPKPDPRTIAGRAGLKDGDQIVQIGDAKVDNFTFRQFLEEFEKQMANRSVPLVVSRTKGSGEMRSVVLDFGSQQAKKMKPKEPNSEHSVSP